MSFCIHYRSKIQVSCTFLENRSSSLCSSLNVHFKPTFWPSERTSQRIVPFNIQHRYSSFLMLSLYMVHIGEKLKTVHTVHSHRVLHERDGKWSNVVYISVHSGIMSGGKQDQLTLSRLFLSLSPTPIRRIWKHAF